MNKIYGYYENSDYQVGMSGGTITIINKNDNTTKKLTKLKYAYTGRINPSCDLFVAREANSLLLIDLPTASIISKLNFSNAYTLNDYECIFNFDGSLFYNVFLYNDFSSEIRIFDKNLSYIKSLYGPSKECNIICLEQQNDRIYILYSKNEKYYVGMLVDGNITDGVELTDNQSMSIIFNRIYYQNGKTDYIKKCLFQFEKLIPHDNIHYISLERIYTDKICYIDK